MTVGDVLDEIRKINSVIDELIDVNMYIKQDNYQKTICRAEDFLRDYIETLRSMKVVESR